MAGANKEFMKTSLDLHIKETGRLPKVPDPQGYLVTLVLRLRSRTGLDHQTGKMLY